ncbi:ATP-binding protein, partial [candidate division KSB1 bacterium]
IKNININENILECATEIRNLFAEMNTYLLAEKDIPKRTAELNESISKIDSYIEKIGSDWNEEKISVADISLEKTDAVRIFNNDFIKLTGKLELAEHDRTNLKREYEKCRSSLNDSEGVLEEFGDAPGRNINDLNTFKEKYEILRERIAGFNTITAKLNTYIDRKNDNDSTLANLSASVTGISFLPAFLLFLPGVITSVLYFFTDLPFTGLASINLFVLSAVFTLITLLNRRRNTDLRDQISRIRDHINDIEQNIKGMENQVAEINKEIFKLLQELHLKSLPDDSTIRNLLRELEHEKDRALKFEQLKKDVSERSKTLEYAEKALSENEKEVEKIDLNIQTRTAEWKEWLKKEEFDENLVPESILNIYEEISKAKNEIKNKNSILERIGSMQDTIRNFQKSVTDVLERSKSGIDKQLRPETIAENLFDELNDNNKLMLELKRLKSQSEEKESLIKMNGDEISNIRSFLEKLLQSEILAEPAGNSGEIKVLAENLFKSLKDPDNTAVTYISAEEENIENILRDLNKDKDDLNHRTGSLESEISHLENYDSYNDKLFNYETISSELNSTVKKWASLKIAKILLDNAKKKYEEERQPDILKSAGKYISKITSDKYNKIVSPIDEDTFYISDNNLNRKDIKYQLSRGTAEEIYFSIRLGLISDLSSRSEPLPVIMDDIFVNMDDTRAPNALKCLHTLLETNQVIIFTCHKDTKKMILKEYPHSRVFQLQDGKLI